MCSKSLKKYASALLALLLLSLFSVLALLSGCVQAEEKQPQNENGPTNIIILANSGKSLLQEVKNDLKNKELSLQEQKQKLLDYETKLQKWQQDYTELLNKLDQLEIARLEALNDFQSAKQYSTELLKLQTDLQREIKILKIKIVVYPVLSAIAGFAAGKLL